MTITRTTTPPFPLARFGDELALATSTEALTYAQLADLVAARAESLGTPRRLLLLEGDRTVDTLVTYLAALQAGHVVLWSSGAESVESLTRAYRPDVQWTADDGLVEHQPGSRHDLHPDLALLLSTSGSTGSPKLVRLSRRNLEANAEGIADALAITADDRALTTLPWHYCYGLSVVHSHLSRGAGLLLTDLSVVDECLWRHFVDWGGTSFAGVPHTFDLLGRSGFADRDLPSLRMVTQAGGRMAAGDVRRWAGLGAERGWSFVTMYGQTEATARMAVMPPQLVAEHPSAVGLPVPGGTLELERVPESEAAGVDGELVYSGPNVMMGYAETPDDLGRGAEIDRLRTGDLARRRADGLLEIVGRRSRFAKPFGLRVDLDDLERRLHDRGELARVVSDDRTLTVFRTKHRGREDVRWLVASLCRLPEGAVDVRVVAQLPHTPAGKPDYATLRAWTSDPPELRDSGSSADQLRDLYAALLGRPDATVDDSFTSLGGDSLSYVEMSTQLDRRLGRVPDAWPRMSLRDLSAAARPRRRGARMETSVLLRAAGIMLVLLAHTQLVSLQGGAHLLLAIAGYHFARLVLPGPDERQRVRRGLAALSRIVVPAVVWIAGVAVVTSQYDVSTVLLLHAFEGESMWSDQARFWFLEGLAWSLVLAVAVLAVPWADRLERRRPFALPLGLLLVASAWRFAVVGIEAEGYQSAQPWVIPWIFLLGWTVARAEQTWQRVVVTVLTLVTTYGFFGDVWRESVVVLGVCLLLWVRAVPVPRVVTWAVAPVAAASLWIYLSHWHLLDWAENHRLAQLAACVALGVALSWAWSVVVRQARTAVTRPTSGAASAAGPRPSVLRTPLPTAGRLRPRGRAAARR